MIKAEAIQVSYEPSDTVEKQGNRASIERYLRKGYIIKQNRNGYWVLVKTARVTVTVSCGQFGQYVFDMKQGICDFYGRTNISEKLLGQFYNDFRSGIIQIWIDNGRYMIKRS